MHRRNILNRPTVLAFCAPFGLMSFAGCGRDSGLPEMAPVKGIVLYQGKPVEEAMVEFFQEGIPFRSMGMTDEAGRFELTSMKPGDGAPVGKNKVLVTIRPVFLDPRAGGIDHAALEKIEDPEERRLKSVEMESQAMANYRASLGLKAKAPEQSPLPQKYAARESTDLELEVVAAQQNEFQVVLTD